MQEKINFLNSLFKIKEEKDFISQHAHVDFNIKNITGWKLFDTCTDLLTNLFRLK